MLEDISAHRSDEDEQLYVVFKCSLRLFGVFVSLPGRLRKTAALLFVRCVQFRSARRRLSNTLRSYPPPEPLQYGV